MAIALTSFFKDEPKDNDALFVEFPDLGVVSARFSLILVPFGRVVGLLVGAVWQAKPMLATKEGLVVTASPSTFVVDDENLRAYREDCKQCLTVCKGS